MSISKFHHTLVGIAISSALLSTSSCDYLDVVPPEQVSVSDGMENYNRALGFLYSCYSYTANNDCDIPYGSYLSDITSSTDDYVLPHSWATDSYGYLNMLLSNTLSAANNHNVWYYLYSAIGQCHLFLQQLDEVGLPRNVVSQEEAEEWKAEVQALRAYFHLQVLRRYGPAVISESLIPSSTPSSEFRGRYHFDYCVDWIVKELDEAAEKLPATRPNLLLGRMTSTVCKALKARALLLAASPLWNGEFPYTNFRNTTFETPGYGTELVSRTYSAEKWERALQACDEAIRWAEGNGERELYQNDIYADQGIDLDKLYVPGDVTDDFKKYVMRMRYLHCTSEGEGNKETIWSTNRAATDGNSVIAQVPRNIFVNSEGLYTNGWSGISPTLYAATHFLTDEGLLPENDPRFGDESNWYKSAGLDDPEGVGRDRIINLNVNREPRFYAYIAFDGGDFSNKIVHGSPLHLNLLDKNKQGCDNSQRNNFVTGFLSQKYIHPLGEFTMSGGSFQYDLHNSGMPALKLIRLAELYLSRAECHAQLGHTDEAIADVNRIRTRAGANPLEPWMISESMSLMDWVRNERFIEFWSEGQRYYDVRRWVKGDEFLGLDKRTGLNGLVDNPTFEEFNQRTSLPYGYTWGNKLYLYPIHQNEVYANPMIVQNPGY